MVDEVFEDVRKVVFEDFNDSDADKIIDLCKGHTDILYDYWLEIEGRQLSNEWVIFNGDDIIEHVNFLNNHFIKWLENVN